MVPHAAKLILVAHRDVDVRDRFVAALADARHVAVTASSQAEAISAAATRPRVSLALIDLTLADDPSAFVRALRDAAQPALPVLVYAGSVRSGAQARHLTTCGIGGYVNEHAATATILPALAPHLFPASFDRRLTPRLVMSVPVTYRSGGIIAGAVTLNLSRGGVAIRTLSPLTSGTQVELRFRLPGWPDDVERTGHVIWSNARVGMGVQFDDEIDV